MPLKVAVVIASCPVETAPTHSSCRPVTASLGSDAIARIARADRSSFANDMIVSIAPLLSAHGCACS